MALYKMGEVVEILQSIDKDRWNRDKVNQWYKRGVVIPHTPPPRRGAAAKYSYENLLQFVIIEDLCEMGITQATASKIVKRLPELFGDPSTSFGDVSTADHHFNYDAPGFYLYVNLRNTDEYEVMEQPPANYDTYMAVHLYPFYTMLAPILS